MKIRLNEIPEDGRQYLINRQTAELNAELQDLIQNAPYNVNLYIRPINSRDFDLTGEIATHTVEQCSYCAEDFNFPIQKKVREILIPEPEADRTGKYAKSAVSMSDDEGLTVSSYKGTQFDLGEFIHEAIALEVPFKPSCEACLKKADSKPFIYDEKMGEDIKPNPFQSLKGLKLN
jgi:uncharacterized protein